MWSHCRPKRTSSVPTTIRSESIGIEPSAGPSVATSTASTSAGRADAVQRRAPPARRPDGEHDRQRLDRLDRTGEERDEEQIRRAHSFSGAEPAQGLGRRDEVVGAGERPRVPGQRVASSARQPGHALQHRHERSLVGAEADEHGAVVGDGAERHVASEDLPERVLVGARDVGVCGLVVELDAVGLRSPDHPLLLGIRERLPCSRVVGPFLQEQDRPARAGPTVGDDRDVRGLDQRRVLAAVDEAGQVAIVPVGPARGLLRDGGQLTELGDGVAGHVEDDVVGAPREPEHGVVLGGRHHEAVDCRRGRRRSPSSSAGASAGAASRHSSGLKPATRLTPPIVVRGSRNEATARTRSVPARPPEASNSR